GVEVNIERSEARPVGGDDVQRERLVWIRVELAPGVVDGLDDGGVTTEAREWILEPLDRRGVHQELFDVAEPVLIGLGGTAPGPADGWVDGSNEGGGSPGGKVPMR